jgi:hypothetical protein
MDSPTVGSRGLNPKGKRLPWDMDSGGHMTPTALRATGAQSVDLNLRQGSIGHDRDAHYRS